MIALVLLAQVLTWPSESLLDDFLCASNYWEDWPGKGGRVVLVTLDVAGDARPELFLAQPGQCGSHEPCWLSWEVYTPVDGSQYQYLRSVFFPVDRFRYDDSRHRLETYEREYLQGTHFTWFGFSSPDGHEWVKYYETTWQPRSEEIDLWRSHFTTVYVAVLDELRSGGQTWSRWDGGEPAAPSPSRFDTLTVLPRSVYPAPGLNPAFSRADVDAVVEAVVLRALEHDPDFGCAVLLPYGWWEPNVSTVWAGPSSRYPPGSWHEYARGTFP